MMVGSGVGLTDCAESIASMVYRCHVLVGMCAGATHVLYQTMNTSEVTTTQPPDCAWTAFSKMEENSKICGH